MAQLIPWLITLGEFNCAKDVRHRKYRFLQICSGLGQLFSGGASVSPEKTPSRGQGWCGV